MKKFASALSVLVFIAMLFSCKEAEVPSTEKVELTSIVLEKTPDKTSYKIGESFDPTGMAVNALYSNGSKKNVTDNCTVSGFDSSKENSSLSLSVVYRESDSVKYTTFSVSVQKEVVVLTGIQIKTLPTKTEYFAGEELDTAGMVVTQNFSDGTNSDISSGWTTSGFDSSTANDSLQVTVKVKVNGVEKTATFCVKIKENPLVSITVAGNPTKTEYLTGEIFDFAGMTVTANYFSGMSRVVTDLATNFSQVTAGLNKTVTVSYTEKGITKTADVTGINKASYVLTETPVALPSGTDGTFGTSGCYVLFGDFPQTVLPKNGSVTVSAKAAGNGYYIGSDGNYYAKAAENGFVDPWPVETYTFKYKGDGSTVGTGSTSYRYFKVEPIKWRVLASNYAAGSENAKLLLAENTLTANVPYYKYNNRSNTRCVGSDTVIYPNNYKYSQIRAYLNGLDYYDDSNVSVSTYRDKGFLQSAFTATARNKIMTTLVVNDASSTTDSTGTLPEETKYVCADTRDKIFLLSQREATNKEWFLGTYIERDHSRYRETTDYALANFSLSVISNHEDLGGLWWLRSPTDNQDSSFSHNAYVYDCVSGKTNTTSLTFGEFYNGTYVGVVPALCVPQDAF